MSSSSKESEKLEILKQQEIFLKEFIKRLENQRERLEVESTELKIFINKAEKELSSNDVQPGCSKQFESPKMPDLLDTKEEPICQLDLNPNINIVQSELEKFMGEFEEEEDDDDDSEN